jgi:hypothetical protein
MDGKAAAAFMFFEAFLLPKAFTPKNIPGTHFC